MMRCTNNVTNSQEVARLCARQLPHQEGLALRVNIPAPARSAIPSAQRVSAAPPRSPNPTHPALSARPRTRAALQTCRPVRSQLLPLSLTLIPRQLRKLRPLWTPAQAMMLMHLLLQRVHLSSPRLPLIRPGLLSIRELLRQIVLVLMHLLPPCRLLICLSSQCL